MAKAYTPGLKVAAKTALTVRRSLPVPGEVLVALGDRVNAETVVARTYTDGDIIPAHVARQLGVPASELPGAMLKKVGDDVREGEIIARSKGVFGMFRREATSPGSGTIESISATTGQAMIRGPKYPVEVKAYLPGRVAAILEREGAIIENEAMHVQGIFGIGGEAFGPIRVACPTPEEPLDAHRLAPAMRGCVVIGGARMTAEALKRAREIGVAALVSGGIDDQDLKDFLGYDLGVAITGSERLGLTFIVTEGFGDIAMADRTHRLLAAQEGKSASVTGATQIRAGVMRPEIVVALGDGTLSGAVERERSEGELALGTQVRVIRDPYFGRIGSVAALPTEPQVLGSGSRARVLEVALAGGERVVVPRANVELIEGS